MHDKIIGVWCTGAPGCFARLGDHYLTFREDGSGRYDLQSLCCNEYFEYESTTFRWSHPKSRHLTIVGVQYFRFRLQGPLQELQESRAHFQDVPYEIDLETDDRGDTGSAFRANLWVSWENAFWLRMARSCAHESWLTTLGVSR